MSTSLGRGFDERAPLVLVLDTSASMGNPPEAPRIAELNAALRNWMADAGDDVALRGRLEIAVVTFGSSAQVLEWPDADSMPGSFRMAGDVTVPTLGSEGLTLMLPAIELALDLARERTRELNAEGIPSRRPQVWLLTDGAPCDERGEPVTSAALADMARRLRTAEQASGDSPGCLFYAIGVVGADRATLNTLAPESNRMLPDFSFRDILRLAEQSASSVRSDTTASEAYTQVQAQADLLRELSALEEGQL
jgi:uncharacterized protein YegL